MPERPLRVLIGKESYSEDRSWADLVPLLGPDLAGRVTIDWCPHGRLAEHLPEVDPDVVIPLWSPLPGDLIRTHRFGLIQQLGAGVDNIDLVAAEQAGVWVANLPGYNAGEVAEHAIMLLLALARRLPEATSGFQPGHWGAGAGHGIAGSTVCLIGTGAVGTAIAQRLRTFGVKLIAVRRHANRGAPVPYLDVGPTDQLTGLVGQADAVIIAATPEPGRGPLVDAGVIAAMRPGALLINVARGALLDQDAALAAVDSGHLAGLGLDVFTPEPYPPDGPLLHHPKVIATPHNASLTTSYFETAARAFVDILTSYLRGEPPRHLLTNVATPRWLPGPAR